MTGRHNAVGTSERILTESLQVTRHRRLRKRSCRMDVNGRVRLLLSVIGNRFCHVAVHYRLFGVFLLGFVLNDGTDALDLAKNRADRQTCRA